MKKIQLLINFIVIPVILAIVAFYVFEPGKSGFEAWGSMVFQRLFAGAVFAYAFIFQIISHFAGYKWPTIVSVILIGGVFTYTIMKVDCSRSGRRLAFSELELKHFDKWCFSANDKLEGRSGILQSALNDTEKYNLVLEKSGEFPERGCFQLHRSLVKLDEKLASQALEAGVKSDCRLGMSQPAIGLLESTYRHRSFLLKQTISSKKTDIKSKRSAEEKLIRLEKDRLTLGKILNNPVIQKTQN